MGRIAYKLLLIAAGVILWVAAADADVLIDETNLTGLPSVAPPAQYSFTATAAEALTATLTDLELPAAFTSLQIAVTQGDTLVGTPAAVDATHSATLHFTSVAGADYVLRVIGTPGVDAADDTAPGVGSFGVCVTRDADPTPRSCVANYSFSANIQAPATASATGLSTLDTYFMASAGGVYKVTLTDHSFPVLLANVSAGIFQGSTAFSVNIPSGPTPTLVTLPAAGTYNLLVAANADANVKAGLYGILITDPSGAPVFNRTIPVGVLSTSSVVNNPTARPLGLTVNDFAFPAALTTLDAAVTAGAQMLANVTASSKTQTFSGPAGDIEVWHYAVAGAQSGVYSLVLAPAGAAAGASLLALTPVVNPAASGTSGGSYAFVENIPTAGTYNLAVKDFKFPSALASLGSASIAQNGAVLAQTNGNFTAAAGLAIVVVDAEAPASGSGIFGVSVQTTGSSPSAIPGGDQTQAVGGDFVTRSIDFGSSGGYDVTLTDLGFPATFATLAVTISRAAQVLGTAYGGGKIPISGTPGVYVLTLVTTPSSPPDYGLYSIRMASSPPTVTLSANPSSVTTGQATQLTWSSEDASACTASGASDWTGNRPLSGTTGAIVAATGTLTLTCTGAGGSTTATAQVTAVAPPAKSGGGGTMNEEWLEVLAGLLCLGARFRSKRESQPMS